MISYVGSIEENICLVVLDFAGLSTRPLDIKEFLISNDKITKVAIDMFSECKDNGFNCKIDLRVTTNAAKHIDLSAAEYAKKPDTSKYYKDKLKLVLSGFIHLRKYISNNDTTAELKSVPLMLVEGLEGVSFFLSLVDDEWLAIQKINAIDIPNNVDSIKNGEIKLYIDGLNLFRVCDIHTYMFAIL